MLTKATLAKELKKSGFTYREAIECINTLLDSISTGLSQNNRFELRGFGTFYVARQAARKISINGHTSVPAHGKVVFRPCDKLRRSVWNCIKN